MNKFLRVSKTLLVTYYAYMLEYRAELFLWALSGALPFILMGVWMQAAEIGQFGLKSIDFARYFLAAFIVRQTNVVWVIWEFEKEVVQGTLSNRLLQPLDPVWHHFASHVAERFARLPFVCGLVLLFFALYPQAFWLERASAIEQFWFLLYLFLSGLAAPLEVFPAPVREVVLWTPFPYFIHFPASILIGLPVDVGRGLLVMLGWAAVFFVWNRWLWRQGLKQYSGMGA